MRPLAQKLGYKTFTVDIDPQFNCDYTVDILDFDVNKVPFKPDVIWASPPCQTFSIASVSHHWLKNSIGLRIPKTKEAKMGIKILEKTVEIIKEEAS